MCRTNDDGEGADDYQRQLEERNAELEAEIRELANLKTISITTSEAYERLLKATNQAAGGGSSVAAAAGMGGITIEYVWCWVVSFVWFVCRLWRGGIEREI